MKLDNENKMQSLIASVEKWKQNHPIETKMIFTPQLPAGSKDEPQPFLVTIISEPIILTETLEVVVRIREKPIYVYIDRLKPTTRKGSQ